MVHSSKLLPLMTYSNKRFGSKKVRLFVRERGKSAVRGTINAHDLTAGMVVKPMTMAITTAHSRYIYINNDNIKCAL